MNIENTFIKKGLVQRKERNFYYIKFLKKKSYEEIFQLNEEIILKWFNILKKFCILTKFGKNYKSVQLLGRGNSALVYEVVNLSSKKKFATKVFKKKNFIDNEKEKKSLLNEIKIMRIVDNAKILKLIETYEGENHIYFVMKLYKGDNLLNHLIKNGYQPEKKALNLLLQLL